MSTRPSPYRLDNQLSELHQSAANLTRYACIVSSRHIKDGVLRGRFNRTMAYYVRQILVDVRNGRLIADEGLLRIQAEHKHIQKSAQEIGKQVAGLISGGVVVATGVGICYASVGVACGVAGLPMIAHGSNNMYENGANLWTGRSDVVGPVRGMYQNAAVAVGGTKSQGSVAYWLADMGLAGYGLVRPVLKPGSWTLFYRMKADHVPAYKLMGSGALIFEAYIAWLTSIQIMEAVEK
ncbi:DUF4225 domain-containing protein [Pseudomonas sp. Marseille-P9899]|uniref:DUF4225 domain-containing protein n=1 Tax=Pseudomonas sp. Marseille-P9899 TaxID=2730401 RepID=UPI00158C8D6E|nr:DUF4225 domain-containing protein [Pseudomonas sp. Marseille-P9899]